MASRFPVVNPEPTQEESDAMQAAGTKYINQRSTDPYPVTFPFRVAKEMVRYGLTFGGGGEKDFGPAINEQMAQFGNSAFKAAAHDGFYTPTLLTFLVKPPTNVGESPAHLPNDPEGLRNRALAAEEKLKNAENTILRQSEEIATLKARIAELEGAPPVETPKHPSGPSGGTTRRSR